MTTLMEEKCEACRADAPKVTDDELAELIRAIPDWNIEVRDGVMQLEKLYQFKNFVEALDFSQRAKTQAQKTLPNPACHRLGTHQCHTRLTQQAQCAHGIQHKMRKELDQVFMFYESVRSQWWWGGNHSFL